MKNPPPGWPRISTGIYYADAARAIDWLVSAFGFEVRLKIEGDGGRIEHSELTFHGGVIMSLLDVALCTAARTLHPDSLGVITIDMSTSFIGGGSGARLLAEARVLKNGRSMIFVEGEAKNEDGSLVAKAIATVRVRLKEK